MNIFLAVFFVLLLQFVDVEASTFVYGDMLNPLERIVINTSSKRIVIRDKISHLSTCDKDYMYHCFSSNLLSFAIPRKNIDEIQDWKMSGLQFRNMGIKKIKLLGIELDAYHITATQSKIRYNFLYSVKWGLVLIGLYDLNMNFGKEYILRGVKGYGYTIE